MTACIIACITACITAYVAACTAACITAYITACITACITWPMTTSYHQLKNPECGDRWMIKQPEDIMLLGVEVQNN